MMNWVQFSEKPAENLCSIPIIRLITTIAPNDTVTIAIANNGPPIPSDLSDRIFDPFFTTKPVGKGTGLGLSTVYAIVVEHLGGKLTCKAPVNNGETIFTVQIGIRQPLTLLTGLQTSMKLTVKKPVLLPIYSKN